MDYNKIAKMMAAVGWGRGVYQNTPKEEDMRKIIVCCFDRCVEELEASAGHSTFCESLGFKVTVCKTNSYVQVDFVADSHWADEEGPDEND